MTSTPADLTIRFTPADGVTLDGSTRGDGVYDVLRTLGLNWRAMRDGSGVLYVRGSRDRDIARYRSAIDRTRAALEAAGRTVAVDIEDGFRPAEQRRADADDRAADRAEMLHTRAARRFGDATAQCETNRQQAGRMTDEPIKIGHHSERRHRRDVERLRAGSTKANELHSAAVHAANRAAGVEANAAHRKNPRAIMRRIDLLESQRRGYARSLTGYERPSYNGRGEVVYVEKYSAATGQRAEDLTRWDARDAEEIGHLRALLADMEAAGTFAAWAPEHFQPGDLVRVLGSWLPVRRVNRKSLSVPGGYGMAGNDASWNATVTWDKVEGRRRDGFQLDTPNGEPWPVELAARVARWSTVHWGRHAHHYPHGSDEERAARHALYAMRITHGLDLGASDAQVTAIRDSITGTGDVRALASAYLTVFDRLQAGELAPAIRDSVTPITGDPAWTLPDGDPVDVRPADLRPGDLVAGAWDTVGLRGGPTTTLHRGFCGPVAEVGSVRDYGELGRWVMVTLTTGDRRDFSETRWIAAYPADGGDPAGQAEPTPDGDPADGEPVAPAVDHVALTGSALADGAHTVLAQLATDLTRDGDSDGARAVWELAARVVTADPTTTVRAGEVLHMLSASRWYPRGVHTTRATARLAELLAPVPAGLAPGHVVRARMTTGARVATVDVAVGTVDRLGCGCQRVRAERPDGRPVELLGGCSFHPAELEVVDRDPPAEPAESESADPWADLDTAPPPAAGDGVVEHFQHANHAAAVHAELEQERGAVDGAQWATTLTLAEIRQAITARDATCEGGPYNDAYTAALRAAIDPANVATFTPRAVWQRLPDAARQECARLDHGMFRCPHHAEPYPPYDTPATAPDAGRGGC